MTGTQLSELFARYGDDVYRYGYLVTIGAKDGAGHPVDFSGKKFTFSVRKLLWGQTRGQLAALRPDWSTVPPFPADTARYILGGSGEGFQTYSGWTSGGEALVLLPGGWQLQLTDGVSISAAGFRRHPVKTRSSEGS